MDNAEVTKTGYTRSIEYTIDRCETLEERSEADQIAKTIKHLVKCCNK